MDFKYSHLPHDKLLLTWKPIKEEDFFLLSFHVVRDAEPLSIIIYPQMIQSEEDHVYCVVSSPPFTFGKIKMSSFSELMPDVTKRPIRTEMLDYFGYNPFIIQEVKQ